jgi:hypothetical protein
MTKSFQAQKGSVTPALGKFLRNKLASEGIEVLSEEQTAYVDAWARKHYPRKKYLTDTQLDQALTDFANGVKL